MNRTTYWLDWKKKIIQPSSPGLNTIPWAEIEKYPLTIYCDQNTWPYIEIEKHTALTPEQAKLLTTNEEKRTYQIGLATIKEIRGGTKENPEGLGSQALKKCFELCPDFVSEHPSHSKEVFEWISGWVYPPRFENLQQGIFSNVWKIDIKSCYANIMRDYPLPWGEPQHITDPELIEQNLQQGKEGFIRFLLKAPAQIKNNQIPFVPDFNNNIKSKIKGRLLLSTKLFKTFKKQYKIPGKIYYTDFWIFEEKKGCVDKYLNYCEEVKKTNAKQGKLLINAFYGAIGKSRFGGYNYRAWTLAVRHLAILQTYYLYRLFKSENVLAIREDCVYVKEELPEKLNKELYHLEKIKLFGTEGESNIFNFDRGELKSFANDQARKELIGWFESKNKQTNIK
ncbi:MAG: hypothetical protein MRECE_13c039 [Mycoplasmataceae bacterium CE_OT135]|nr:MAG: hypothetical protein MRECE_13c039 [Mycoplasmataceae bacterium CE_OT135]